MKNKYTQVMNYKKLITLALALTFGISMFAQDEPDNRPVRGAFEATYLMENQTVLTPYKGSMEFQMAHRFGLINNGIEDIFGIYATANTRIGLNYGITDDLMIGLGTTKDYKLQDLNWKYSILKQTRSGSMPIFLTYFGNMVVDARDEENFYPQNDYRFIHRISYFTQFIVGRKFTDWLSLQASPNFIYYNAVEPGINNFHYGFYAGGRAKVYGSISAIAEYQQLFSETSLDAEPGLGFGVEITTATHSFQIYLSNYNAIIPQRSMLFNSNSVGDGELLFGFNIVALL